MLTSFLHEVAHLFAWGLFMAVFAALMFALSTLV